MHFYEAKCINYLFVGVFFEPDMFFRIQMCSTIFYV